MTPQDFQQVLKKQRKRLGLTQQELADKVGVGKPTINQFELGKQNITVDVLCRIMSALDLNILVCDDDYKAKFQLIIEIAKTM